MANDVTKNALEVAVADWTFANPAAKDDFIELRAKEFNLVNGVIVHRETGTNPAHGDTVQKFYRAKTPHYFPVAFERSTADKAFVDGHLASRAALIREVGEAEANRIAREQYGLNGVGDTRRGKSSEVNDDDPAKKSHAKNPWHPDYAAANGAEAAQVKRIEIISSLGASVAANLAKAAGMTIAGTPLRR